MTYDEWRNDFKEYVNTLDIPRDDHNGIIEYIDELPSAQPEIIRCKDCDWWTKQKDSLQGRCELMQMYPTGAWYCGNAKRRTDG